MAEMWQRELSDRTIGKASKKLAIPEKELTLIENEIKKREKNLDEKLAKKTWRVSLSR